MEYFDLFKLFLVPAVVFAISVIDKKFGSKAAGFFAGFPAIAFPLFIVLSFDHDIQFLKTAALYGALGVFPYSLYAFLYLRFKSWQSLEALFLVAIISWVTLSALIVHAPIWAMVPIAIVAGLTLWTLSLKGSITTNNQPSLSRKKYVLVRVIMSFIVTAIIIVAADRIGSRNAGLFTAFPIAGSVVLFFNARADGAAGITNSVRGLVSSIPSLLIFFVVSFIMLDVLAPALAFICGFVCAIVTAFPVRRLIRNLYP